MALEHAIVVSLLEQSGSGYELARRFDRSIGFFWAASHQQIYRVLGRMAEQGWVEVTVVAQAGRPDKKVYEVTAAGRAALSAWLREPSEPEQLRSDLAVKLRAAAFDDPAAVIADVVRHRAAHAERLALYRGLEERDFGGPLGRRERLQLVVLRAGIRYEVNWLECCDEMVEALGDE